MTLLCSPTELVVEGFEGCCLRYGVGHIEEARNSSVSCCPTLALDVGFCRHPRLAEVYVVVDDSRQNETSRSIDNTVDVTGCFTFYYLCNVLVVDEQMCLEASSLVYEYSITD